MIKLPIGTGDFEREISVEVDGKEGLLKLIRTIGKDYGERKNESGAFMYSLFLDSARLKVANSSVELAPRCLLRIAPDARYSIEPAMGEQPQKMRKGDLPYNPIKTVTFIPPMLEEPAKAAFSQVRVFKPDERTRDWYCGYYNDGEELGISPIEIAHGYVYESYLLDPTKNTPHYHRQVLEGWVPVYGLVDGIFSAVFGVQVSKNSFTPIQKNDEQLSKLISQPDAKKLVEISLDNITATTPGEAHVLNSVRGSGIWETITFKYPGLCREDSDKDKVEYNFGA